MSSEEKTLPAEQEKAFNEWLASAMGIIQTAEQTDTFANLEDMLGKFYSAVAASQSEGGLPSPAAFRAVAPELRARKLSMLVRDAEDITDALADLLENLAEYDPVNAVKLADVLMRGNAPADFKARLMQMEEKWREHMRHEEKELLRRAGMQIAPPEGDASEPQPEPPKHRDHRLNPEKAFATADRIMRSLVDGEAAGG
ncbi:MAG TPA: hypothetical protein VHB73_01705 [Alphaproteobacteria bacterium]|nr:hypothetical protein [Alphaproteobacteria bacterium]